MGLRLASDSTDTITLSDGTTLTVRADISKAEIKRLAAGFPNRKDVEKTGMTPAEGIDFQAALFETLVTGWSMDFAATKANYLKLATPDPLVDEMDLKLAEHFEKLSGPTEAVAGKQ